jgi:hypothetical protein
MNMDNVVTVTTELETEIRNSIDQFLIVSKGSNSNTKLHIPDGEKPLCGRTVAKKSNYNNNYNYQEWKLKDTAVYPRGHKDICKYCATEYTNE